MAERGYLPKIFQKRSKYGTPTTGIIVGTIVIIVFGCADFGQLCTFPSRNTLLTHSHETTSLTFVFSYFSTHQSGVAQCKLCYRFATGVRSLRQT